jgi:hypothetical protein
MEYGIVVAKGRFGAPWLFTGNLAPYGDTLYRIPESDDE